MSHQRVSYVTMVFVAAHFPMILSLMIGFQIRVSITLNNRAIKLKLLCFFIHVYLQAICEMIKYFTSLIRGGATCKKNSKSRMRSCWWPLSIKDRF